MCKAVLPYSDSSLFHGGLVNYARKALRHIISHCSPYGRLRSRKAKGPPSIPPSPGNPKSNAVDFGQQSRVAGRAMQPTTSTELGVGCDSPGRNPAMQ